MRTSILLLSILISVVATGQNSTLVVEGKSKLSVKPDLTIFEINVKTKDQSYSKCIEGLNNKSNLLKAKLEEIGVSNETQKTASYDVTSDYVYETRKNEGFIANQNVSLVFPFSIDQINKIINVIKNFGEDIEYKVTFSLSDEKKKELRYKLVDLAVLDAINKANIICNSSKTQLMDIVKIDYGPESMMGHRVEALDFYGNGMSLEMAAPPIPKLSSIEPKEIEIIDYVVITWNIQKK